MESIRRPNRSEIHVSMEEEKKIEEKTREYFDGIAPKRPLKPQRSEYVYYSCSSDHHYSDPNTNTTINIIPPEFIKFQHLQNDDHHQKVDDDDVYNNGINQVVVGGGGVDKQTEEEEEEEEEEEYRETEYYKDLNCIDKQHHTTGTGFIRVLSENINGGGDNCFKLAQDSTTGCRHYSSSSSSSKGNPATNDWIPSEFTADTELILASHSHHQKPNRSE